MITALALPKHSEGRGVKYNSPDSNRSSTERLHISVKSPRKIEKRKTVLWAAGTADRDPRNNNGWNAHGLENPLVFSEVIFRSGLFIAASKDHSAAEWLATEAPHLSGWSSVRLTTKIDDEISPTHNVKFFQLGVRTRGKPEGKPACQGRVVQQHEQKPL